MPFIKSTTQDKPTHHHGICSASIGLRDPPPADVFDFWLDTLIALKGPNILRIKGIVHVEGIGWPFVFHGVQHIFDAPVPLEAGPVTAQPAALSSSRGI